MEDFLQSQIKNPSVCEGSDNESVSSRMSLPSRKISRIPRACPTNVPNSARSAKAQETLTLKSCEASPESNSPDVTKFKNTSKVSKPTGIPSNCFKAEKSARDLELKLIGFKKQYSLLQAELAQKLSRSARLRLDVVDTAKKINELNGREASLDNAFVDLYSKNKAIITELVSKIPEGWHNIALRIATAKKEAGEPIKEFNDIIEQEQLRTQNKIATISKKVEEIASDADARIMALEIFLGEKLQEIQSLEGRLAHENEKKEERPSATRSQQLITKYQAQITESNNECRRLQEKLENKTAVLKTITEKRNRLKQALYDTQGRDRIEILKEDKKNLSKQLKEKTDQVTASTEENRRLKAIIEQGYSHKSTGETEDSNVKQAQAGKKENCNEEQLARSKKEQAKLDGKHHFCRKQIQNMKFQIALLEKTIKKLSTAEEAVIVAKEVKTVGQKEVIGSGYMSTILKIDGSEEISRLESLIRRMQEDKQRALKQKTTQP